MKINEVTVVENEWLANLIRAINLGKNIKRMSKQNPRELQTDIINRTLDGAINPRGKYTKGDKGFASQYSKKRRKK